MYSVCTNICSADGLPTAAGAMVKSRRHDASKIAGKKHAVEGSPPFIDEW